jgi:hypothetical protein
VICFPYDLDTTDLRDVLQLLSEDLLQRHAFTSLQATVDRGVILLDGTSEQSDAAISEALNDFSERRAQSDELDPDIWHPIVVRSPIALETKLR